jgi:hypothetical protein
MKIFLLTIAFAALTGGFATANSGYNYRACANNNSKQCRDARAAFARHHDGQTPDQWNNQWYQGQQGRWNKQGNNWQWKAAQGDEWFQGKQGHWYQERDGWQWRGDKGDDYGKGSSGWQWSRAGQKHRVDRE